MSRTAWIRIRTHFSPGSGSGHILVQDPDLHQNQTDPISTDFKKSKKYCQCRKHSKQNNSAPSLTLDSLSAQNSNFNHLRMTRNRLIFRPEP